VKHYIAIKIEVKFEEIMQFKLVHLFSVLNVNSECPVICGSLQYIIIIVVCNIDPNKSVCCLYGLIYVFL